MWNYDSVEREGSVYYWWQKEKSCEQKYHASRITMFEIKKNLECEKFQKKNVARNFVIEY